MVFSVFLLFFRICVVVNVIAGASHGTSSSRVDRFRSLDVGLYPSIMGELYTIERVVALQVHYRFDVQIGRDTTTACLANSTLWSRLNRYLTESAIEAGDPIRNHTRKKRFISALIGIVSGAVGIGVGIRNYVASTHIEAELNRLKLINEQLQQSNNMLYEEIGKIKSNEDLIIVKYSSTLKNILHSLEDLTCEVAVLHDNIIPIIDFIFRTKNVMRSISNIHTGQANEDDLLNIVNHEEIFNAISRSNLITRQEITHSLSAATVMSGHWSDDKQIYSFIIWLPVCRDNPLPVYHFHSVGYHRGVDYIKCAPPHHLVIQHDSVYQLQLNFCIIKNTRFYFCPSYARYKVDPFSSNSIRANCQRFDKIDRNTEIVLTDDGILIYTTSNEINVRAQDSSGFESSHFYSNDCGTFFLQDENITSIVTNNTVIYQRLKLEKTLYIPHLVFKHESARSIVWDNVIDPKFISGILTTKDSSTINNYHISGGISIVISVISIVISYLLWKKLSNLSSCVREVVKNDVILLS